MDTGRNDHRPEGIDTSGRTTATTNNVIIVPRTVSPSLAASLRSRVSPGGRRMITPTRTLRLTEAEQAAAAASNAPLSVEVLTRQRPRSNPHSRAPMRYESPLNNDEFRIGGDDDNNNNNNNNNEHRDTTPTSIRRISATRPLAGTTPATTVLIREDRPLTPAKSNKQGPSHRKVRRWNNGHFVNLASEIGGNTAAADVLRKAQSEAHLYRAIYDPAEHKPAKNVDEFLHGSGMKHVREMFFEGELGGNLNNLNKTNANTEKRVQGMIRAKQNPSTVMDCMNRIDSRLRRVVVRACSNSYAAAEVTRLFEQFIVESFAIVKKKKKKHQKKEHEKNHDNDKNNILLDGYWWKDLLLECPTVSERTDGRITAQFFFDSDSSTGGFHRLLLHAVSQFHGLQAMSKMIHNLSISSSNENEDSVGARTLIVTGEAFDDKHKFRLVEHVEGNEVKDSNLLSSTIISSTQGSSKPDLADWIEVEKPAS